MTKTHTNEWNANAEAAMMGFTVAVQSKEHLAHMVGYVLHTLGGMYHYDEEEKTEEVVENATEKYNSDKDSVKWFTCNSTSFGTCLTFVRDDAPLVTKSGNMNPDGVLAWVENLDYPECSELGYVFFDSCNGKVRRIA